MRAPIMALAAAAILAPMAAGDAEAILWDLLIDANVTADVSYGSSMTVAGAVTNHAGWPVPDAAVTLRAGPHTAMATTGADGTFETTVDRTDMIPGLHVAQMRASTSDGLLGMASIQVSVAGDVSPSAHTARLLSEGHAMRYLAADASDFEDDPIGAKLYEHYQALQRRLLTERAVEEMEQERREELALMQATADTQRMKMLERETHGDGTYEGRVRDVFVDGLDRSVRPTIVAQLDYTLEAYRAGKEAMRTVLDRGGSMAEALAARNAAAAIPRHVMESLSPEVGFDIDDYPWAAAHMTNSTAGPVEAVPVEETPEAESRNATGAPTGTAAQGVEVGPGVTTVYMSVNGELVRHIFNGTHWTAAE